MNGNQSSFPTKWSMATFIAILILASSVLAAGQTYTTVYRFKGGNDGERPGGLISDEAGNLYGTTSLEGGSQSGGTVYQLSASTGHWTESVIYSFCAQSNCTDGAGPEAELVFDTAGNLYGVTSYGGAAGAGVVFELSPQGNTWTETVIYNFKNYDQPVPGLVFDKAGNLYGAHFSSGEKGRGAVYQLTPSQGGGWTYTAICSFGRRNDGFPSHGPIISEAGNLYGTMYYQPHSPSNGVYELKPPATKGGAWTERVLYTFCSQSNCSDGDNPLGRLIFDGKGTLYGTTYWGGASQLGTVFKLTPQAGAWTESVVYNFCTQSHCADGENPQGRLLFDGKGNLYGTTLGGGGNGMRGTLFQLTPPANQGATWTETVLHRFTGTHGDGSQPLFGVIQGKRGLWGTAYGGGRNDLCPGGCGPIFLLH